MVEQTQCQGQGQCRVDAKKQEAYIKSVWVVVVLGVVMHSPRVEDHDGVFGDEVALVGEVFACDVRGAEPKGIVAALDLCG